MRLLWIKYGELLPLDTGGKLRSFHLLRHLGHEVDLTLLSYVPRGTRAGYEAELAAALPGSRVLRVDGVGGAAPGAVWSALTRDLPLTVSRFTSAAVRETVAREVAAGAFDLVLCDFLAPTDCLPAALPVPTVLFEHNVEARLWARRAETVGGLRRWLYRREHRTLERYEREMLRRFDLTLAVSAADRDTFLAMEPSARVEVLETGVDVAEFAPDGVTPRADNLVVFVGSMDWQPNLDGVLWFAAEIWPRVTAAVPGARFRIVGRRPPAAVQALAGPTIEIAGDVPSVVPHFHEATLTVVPLRSGGGTRLKIYEGMAAGAPTVSTTVGAEGLPLDDGDDILLADTPEAMADAIIRLLRDPAEARRIADTALATVARRDWSMVARDLAVHLRTLPSSRRSA